MGCWRTLAQQWNGGPRTCRLHRVVRARAPTCAVHGAVRVPATRGVCNVRSLVAGVADGMSHLVA